MSSYDLFAIHVRTFPEILAKINNKTHLGLLTETHEVLLRLIKTPNIHVFKMAAPTEDRFPPTIRGRNGLGSETTPRPTSLRPEYLTVHDFRGQGVMHSEVSWPRESYTVRYPGPGASAVVYICSLTPSAIINEVQRLIN